MLKIIGIVFGVGMLGYAVCTIFPAVGQLSGWWFVPVAIVVGIFLKIYEGFASVGKQPERICTHCHTRVTPEVHTPGSAGLELLAWIFFLVPGLLYSLWRRNARTLICPVCKSPNPIPVGSPAAQQIAART
jgi:hypothetical protein